jgi:hypothetical protein
MIDRGQPFFPGSATGRALPGALCAEGAAAGLCLEVVGTVPQTAHMSLRHVPADRAAC